MQLNAVKEFLRIDHSDEDGYLNILLILARELCENYLRAEMPSEIPESINQAMLIIIGYFYENREGTKEGIPTVVYRLLDPYRKVAW